MWIITDEIDYKAASELFYGPWLKVSPGIKERFQRFQVPDILLTLATWFPRSARC
jgi:hypothetical protein